MNITINDVLERLDKWRNFPSYQLERRVDIMFSFFLPTIFEKCLKFSEKDLKLIIPEFPTQTKESKEKGHLRFNRIDYALFYEESEARKVKVLFVELKTDQESIKKEQLKYLVYTRDKHCNGKDRLSEKGDFQFSWKK